MRVDLVEVQTTFLIGQHWTHLYISHLGMSVFGFPPVLCLPVWAGGGGTRTVVGCVPNHLPSLSLCPVPTSMGDTPPLPGGGFANVIDCLAGGQQ